MKEPEATNKLEDAGTISLFIASFCYLGSILVMFVSFYQWAILFAILGIILGNFGFGNLVKSEQWKASQPIKSELPDVHVGRSFDSHLKSGAPVIVTVEIHYPGHQDKPGTLKRIEFQIQHTLNYHLPKMLSLSQGEFDPIDGFLLRDMEPLRKELGLNTLTIRTLDVKSLPVGTTPSEMPSVRFRSDVSSDYE